MKKAVSWALRTIGNRSAECHAAAIALSRRIQMQRGVGPQKGREERKTLHVVPVKVTQQAGTAKALGSLATEIARTSAEVEHDRVGTRDAHHHARRVTAVPPCVVAMAWR